MERRKLTFEEANALYDVVVATCGAREEWRDQWLAYIGREDPWRFGLEFRFQGELGFGGKLLYDGIRPAHVTCYPTELNDRTRAMIELANEALAAVPHPYLRRA